MLLKDLRKEDGQAIADLHSKAFSYFFLTSLGNKFLKVFYQSIIDDPNGIAIGIFDGHQLIAFAVGTLKKQGFYTNILKKNFFALIWYAIPKLVTNPKRVFRLLHSLNLKETKNKKILQAACLLSICVDPSLGNKGYGKKVLAAFEQKAYLNSNTIILTTDAEGNDSVNGFYLASGYILLKEFYQSNRKMNLYSKVMKTKIPFSPPFVDNDVIAEVVSSLNSGWITSGPKVKLLEEEVCKLSKVEKVVCVNSWTSGAILVLKWFGVKEGDEVIIPAYTYSATALAVLHCGAKPIMVDISSDFTINTDLIEKAVTIRTKVIMPVDIAGWPCDYNIINKIVNKEEIIKKFVPESNKQEKLGRILVISDAAHSIGAYYNGLFSGKLTDITIFSFHAVKNVTTAEGGAICINLPDSFNIDDEYKLMKLYTLNGQNKDAFTKSLAGGWRYDILFEGLKVNLPDLCAAVGLAQIRKYNTVLLHERKRVALRYNSFFKKHNIFQLPPLQDEQKESSYHLYALRINDITEIQRDSIIEEITFTGVSVNVHFIPMPMLTVFRNLGYNIDNYPITYDNYSREISLPIYPQLTDREVDYICESVLSSYKKVIG
jgi:dTDP-4-amino-4,6-dideoxygalactose transaminase